MQQGPIPGTVAMGGKFAHGALPKRREEERIVCDGTHRCAALLHRQPVAWGSERRATWPGLDRLDQYPKFFCVIAVGFDHPLVASPAEEVIRCRIFPADAA